jgi:hypothetical protein
MIDSRMTSSARWTADTKPIFSKITKTSYWQRAGVLLHSSTLPASERGEVPQVSPQTSRL